MKRYMSLDLGDATIGVAVSDLLGLTAQGVETVRRTTLEADIARLGQLMQEYEVDALVAGLPKHMNGDEGERCSIVRAFMAEVEEHFPRTEVHWDERLSTVAASRALIAGDVSRKKRRKVIDKMAAVYILQGFLDRQNMGNHG